MPDRLVRPADPPPACDCPVTPGMIRHQRRTCTDPVVARLGWYADDQVAADAPDPVTACLAEVRQRAVIAGEIGLEAIATLYGPDPLSQSPATQMAATALDVPRLLAAVEAVLALHKPVQTVVRHVCAAHALGGVSAEGSRSARAWHIEVDACPDCRKEDTRVCAHCECPHDEWPCKTYQAVTAKLLEEEGT